MSSPAVDVPESVLDPYEVLGVERTATEEEIKASYRKLALQYHPDKQKEESELEAAAAKFQQIVTAYNILKDPERRRKYDAGGAVESMDGIEVDASDLGKLDTARLAMLSKFGVGIRTQVSKHVLTAVETGELTARRLHFHEAITDKVGDGWVVCQHGLRYHTNKVHVPYKQSSGTIQTKFRYHTSMVFRYHASMGSEFRYHTSTGLGTIQARVQEPPLPVGDL